MNVAFDPDMLSVRYAIDRYERCDELLIVRRNEQSVLLAADGQLLTVDLAARHIVRTLTVGFLGLSPDEVFPLSDAPYAS